MQIEVIAVFPKLVQEVFSCGVLSRATSKQLIDIQYNDLRDYGLGKSKKIDDIPYGGGPGMVLSYEPIANCLKKVKSKLPTAKVICASPAGKPLTQSMVEQIASLEQIILLAGRYEGIDERIIEEEVDIDFSLGDYVISGGELALMVLLDAVLRLKPTVLHDTRSTLEESFSDGLLEYPQYTRPRNIAGRQVPEVLFSGNHSDISTWRRQKMLEKTLKNRRDLLKSANLSDEDKEYLEKLGYNRKSSWRSKK